MSRPDGLVSKLIVKQGRRKSIPQGNECIRETSVSCPPLTCRRAINPKPTMEAVDFRQKNEAPGQLTAAFGCSVSAERAWEVTLLIKFSQLNIPQNTGHKNLCYRHLVLQVLSKETEKMSKLWDVIFTTCTGHFQRGLTRQ